MREVRPQTAAQVRAEIEPHEAVDELAHATNPLGVEVRTPEIREDLEPIEEELVDRSDGLPLPEIDRDGGGGGGGGSPEGEAEQFMFVDGQPLLVSRTDRPVGDGAFDATALAAGFQQGGLDLVLDEGLVRMVFNGRLRLSALSVRNARREAAGLERSRTAAATDPTEHLPMGPSVLRFEYASETAPQLGVDGAIGGRTYVAIERAMRGAIAAGEDDRFARMNAELATAFELLQGAAEIHPDLLFQEFKLLLADFATPAFAKHLPDLVSPGGRVDARRWMQGWQRLDRAGATQARDAITTLAPELLRFLLSNDAGAIRGLADSGQISGAHYARAFDATFRFVDRRVTSAGLFDFLRHRERDLRALTTSQVPGGIAFAGDPAFGAAVLGLARAARDGAADAFEDRVLDNAAHGEDDDGAYVEVNELRLRPQAMDDFGRRALPQPPLGFLDRLHAKDLVPRASVDPLAAWTDRVLSERGVEGGLMGRPEASRVVSLVRGVPAHTRSLTGAELSPAVAYQHLNTATALIAQRAESRLAVGAWGSPRLFGVDVSAEDLTAAATPRASRDALTEGLTRLANTLERAGRATHEVDELMALKSRANRKSAEALSDVSADLLELLRTHLTFEPANGHVTPLLVALDGRGSPSLIALSDEFIDELVVVTEAGS